jgi:WD40 repeat protein
LLRKLGHSKSGGTEEYIKAALSPDGKKLAVGRRPAQGEAEMIELWDVQSGKLLHAWPENQGSKGAPWNTKLQVLTFSADSKILASSSDNGETRLRDVQTGKLLGTLKIKATSLAFSPDGKTLAVGSVRGVNLWNLSVLRQHGYNLESDVH